MTRGRMVTMKFSNLAVRGIDISGYNGAIDWAKVKASSHFVIIRAGYGNTTDKTFLANWANASVPKAAYWYMDFFIVALEWIPKAPLQWPCCYFKI